MTNAHPSPRPYFLAECRRLGISPNAANDLTTVGYRTEVGPIETEVELRRAGAILTSDEWSGCVDRTERGILINDLLDEATAMDRSITDTHPSGPQFRAADIEPHLHAARNALADHDGHR